MTRVAPDSGGEFHREVEGLLEALRGWLYELESSGGLEGVDASEADPAAEGDLHALASELAGLRGEVRLQSKGAKAARETMERAASAFTEGLESTRSEIQAFSKEVETGLSGGLSPLVRQCDRLREKLEGRQGEPERRAVESLLDALEGVRRSTDAARRARQRLGWRAYFLPRELIDGLLQGQDMVLGRLERTLLGLGVEEISCLGETFDPACMRAVETEHRDDVPDGQVLEVIRPGYRRAGDVIRAAEVRTAVNASTRETTA